MNTSVIHTISRHITLEDPEAEHLLSVFVPMQVAQGEFIQKTGDATRYFIYVNAGCLMSYYTDDAGNDHVIQFATTGWWTGDLHSLTRQVPSIYSTRALTDSHVMLLPQVAMEPLMEAIPKLERYFRITYQNSLVTHQSRIIQHYTFTAEERYLAFCEKYPSLEQYVPLKYIASYLGITPEFLSKIRRKIMEK